MFNQVKAQITAKNDIQNFIGLSEGDFAKLVRIITKPREDKAKIQGTIAEKIQYQIQLLPNTRLLLFLSSETKKLLAYIEVKDEESIIIHAYATF